MTKLKIGLIGCGMISEIYCKNLTTRAEYAELVACADLDEERSRVRAEQFGLKQMTVEELLSSDEIDAVLNLTIPASHASVSLAALQNGKHVYSEKPLAAKFQDAEKILAEAEKRGLYVGCAPDTFLGAGLQTAYEVIKSGGIGKPLSAVACFSCRGHERWHHNPDFYYQQGGGPHYDMGPYYITALVAALGGVTQIMAIGNRAFAEREIGSGPRKGERFNVDVDTHMNALLQFASGAAANVMLSFDLTGTHLPKLEVYGTQGSLLLPDPNTFRGPVMIKTDKDEDFHELDLISDQTDNLRGLGIDTMCKAIIEGTDHPANGVLAAHVLEILSGMEISAQSGKPYVCKTKP